MTQTLTLDSKNYVVLPRQEYQDLLAKAYGAELPAYPPVDRNGYSPAREFARVSLARKLMVRRLQAGWTQDALAKKAKVRVETISRLEGAKHVPHTTTLVKIDEAFNAAGV